MILKSFNRPHLKKINKNYQIMSVILTIDKEFLSCLLIALQLTLDFFMLLL